MLHILRRIRIKLVKRGDLGRYALYAVGEVGLVVIGILIALQVNNWNEDRQIDRERLQILEDLRADLVQEMEGFRRFMGLLDDRRREAEYVLALLASPEAEIDTAQAVERIVKVGWILVYEPTLATYNEILSSGKLSILESNTLKRRLADYRTQVVDFNSINRTYDEGLKDYERMAVAYLSPIPPAQDGTETTVAANGRIRIDLAGMAADRDLVDRVRHIVHHTQVQIRSTQGLVLPIAKDVVSMIDERLSAG